jgi:hypothetical protein
MELQVIIRWVYGNRLVECVGPQAEHIKTLTGKKTLCDRHIEALKALGFVFVVVNNEEV